MKPVLLLICLFYWHPFKQHAEEADAIVGRWESTKNNLIVHVYREGNTYRAKIVWFKNNFEATNPSDTWLDKKNPDSSLRNRKILGMDVLNNLVYNQKTYRWENGEIYDSTTGRIWSSSAWITENGMLKVRGFWHVEIIGQTLTFRRV